jgi:hypothetical protein
VIGWLYDLLGERSERAGTAQRRRTLLASLEGEVIEIGAGTVQGVAFLGRRSQGSQASGAKDSTT